jgi:hypothetical protein
LAPRVAIWLLKLDAILFFRIASNLRSQFATLGANVPAFISNLGQIENILKFSA